MAFAPVRTQALASYAAGQRAASSDDWEPLYLHAEVRPLSRFMEQADSPKARCKKSHLRKRAGASISSLQCPRHEPGHAEHR